MISKNEIKRIQALHRKKGRVESGLFLVEGVKSVNELVVAGWEIINIFAIQEAVSLLSYQRSISVVSEKEMNAITALSSPSPVCAVARIPSLGTCDYKSLVAQKCILLDGIQDPGNLGTIIRSADWFGVKTILISPASVDPFNPKVVQATMGSIFRVRIHQVDLHQALAHLFSHSSAYPIYGAALGGNGTSALNNSGPGGLLIGSEANGIEPQLLSKATEVVTILGAGSETESLNAAVATGILLYAWTIPQS